MIPAVIKAGISLYRAIFPEKSLVDKILDLKGRIGACEARRYDALEAGVHFLADTCEAEIIKLQRELLELEKTEDAELYDRDTV